MPQADFTCPMTRQQVADRYFLESRAKLIDIAAFLDRLDRSKPTRDNLEEEDFRTAALRQAIALLIDGKSDRARRVLEHFSDPTEGPIPAAGTKGAAGAYSAPPA